MNFIFTVLIQLRFIVFTMYDFIYIIPLVFHCVLTSDTVYQEGYLSETNPYILYE